MRLLFITKCIEVIWNFSLFYLKKGNLEQGEDFSSYKLSMFSKMMDNPSLLNQGGFILNFILHGLEWKALIDKKKAQIKGFCCLILGNRFMICFPKISKEFLFSVYKRDHMSALIFWVSLT